MREWHGVTTDDEGRVTEVILFRDWGDTDGVGLQTLWLNNQLTGEIKPQQTSMTTN